jgi:Flp pilus assembly protein TadG
MRTKGRRRGNATIEFTLVGIPLLCVLISTFEMARGMWLYHTLAYAVKEGARYAAVRGQNSPNQVTLGVPSGGAGTLPLMPICQYIIQQGPGLIPQQVTLTFHSATQPDITATADNCPSTGSSGTASNWPPGGTFSAPQTDASGNTIVDNQAGQVISINASFTFQSTILMFWPGVQGGIQFPSVIFPAKASEVVQY